MVVLFSKDFLVVSFHYSFKVFAHRSIILLYVVDVVHGQAHPSIKTICQMNEYKYLKIWIY